MKTYKLSDNLWLHEYIPEFLYKKFCDEKPHYLMNMIDPRLIELDQFIRDRFGSVTINNWISIKDKDSPLYRQWSGIRTPGSEYYSMFSEHTYGRASDKIFKNVHAEEVREDIEENYSLYQSLGLTCIESGTSWLHSDLRALLYNKDQLLIVYP
jgi:hypothetical protein